MGSLTGGGAGSAGVLKNAGLGTVVSDGMTLRCQTSDRRKLPLSIFLCFAPDLIFHGEPEE